MSTFPTRVCQEMEPIVNSGIVLDSCEKYADKSQHVKLGTNSVFDIAIAKILSLMKHTNYNPSIWKTHPLNPKVADESAIKWIFLCDLLNFSFWSDEEEDRRYYVKYNNQRYTGYWSLCACINRALDEGIPITDPEYYANMSRDQFEHVFRGSNESSAKIPLANERFDIMRSAGKVLLEKYNGSCVELVERASGDAFKLINMLIQDFPSFRDYKYSDKLKGNVYLLKRAQILVADLWACFEGKELGKFVNIDELTVFADYRIPQVLAFMGLLEYSDELQNILNARRELESGSDMELEIRTNSIVACDKLVRMIKTKFGAEVNSVMLDFFLWDYFQDQKAVIEAKVPFHRIRSIYY